MFTITTNNSSVTIENNDRSVVTGEAINNIGYKIADENTIVWYRLGEYLFSSRISDTIINGETINRENVTEKLNAALFFSGDGSGGGITLPIDMTDVNGLITDGEGTKFLSDNGTYKQPVASIFKIDDLFFNPVDNGSGGLTLDGVTWQQIQDYFDMYSSDVLPYSYKVSSFKVTNLIVTNDVAAFSYEWGLLEGAEFSYYRASVSGTDQNIISQVTVSKFDLSSLAV